MTLETHGFAIKSQEWQQKMDNKVEYITKEIKIVKANQLAITNQDYLKEAKCFKLLKLDSI